MRFGSLLNRTFQRFYLIFFGSIVIMASSLLRHRAYRTRLSTSVSNRSRSEFRKRDIKLEVNLGTFRGRKEAMGLNVFEVSQNMLLDLIERQSREVGRMLWKKYGKIKPFSSC